MSIDRLVTENFRNLQSGSVTFHPNINLVIGENGSGKSSLLEALFFLGHGKSFRTTKAEHLVSHDKPHFVVSAKDTKGLHFGLSKSFVDGTTSIRVNGEKHNRLSVLVQNIAVQIVTPESFKLFFGGPKERRRFIDLGMFHVKHDFAKLWSNCSRILKQRNAFLRSHQPKEQLAYWTNAYTEASTIVAQLRQDYIEHLAIELTASLQVLLPSIADQVKVQYLQGWASNKDLLELLLNSYDRESAYGYTLFGAHKFDVRFLIGKQPIETFLSRGQQKLFLLALTFAQAKLIEKVKRVKPILLIDDIGAELDINSRHRLSKVIESMDCQIVITAIEAEVLSAFTHVSDNKVGSEGDLYKMFHVEHGNVITNNESAKSK